MNEALDKAIRQANLNGHHLESNHVDTARRWSCVVCGLCVILWGTGGVGGSADTVTCGD